LPAAAVTITVFPEKLMALLAPLVAAETLGGLADIPWGSVERMPERVLAPIYLDLRAEALSWGPKEIKAPTVVDGGEVLGVVMDIGYDVAVITVVGLADGTTSIYASPGAAKIGMGGSEAVARMSRRWVALAEDANVVDTPSGDLPDEGIVQFTLLTIGVARSSSATEADLQTGASPLSALYAAGQDVIAAVRAVDEAGAAPNL
jgi:hypothetical protein